MFPESVLKWFDYHGLQRPAHLPHGIKDTAANPLSEQLPRLTCRNWRLEGDVLSCDTEAGPMVQRLPSTDYICKGTDADGMPILTKVQPK